jgi:hypothetical protein
VCQCEGSGKTCNTGPNNDHVERRHVDKCKESKWISDYLRERRGHEAFINKI